MFMLCMTDLHLLPVFDQLLLKNMTKRSCETYIKNTVSTLLGTPVQSDAINTALLIHA